VRKIIHVDMDAFYASVEQWDNPDLRGKPVIVAWRASSSRIGSKCFFDLAARSLCPNATITRHRRNARE
jgi:hypothetical protein